MKKKLVTYLLVFAALAGCAAGTRYFVNKTEHNTSAVSSEIASVSTVPFEETVSIECDAVSVEEEPVITLEDAKALQASFFQDADGGLFERINNATTYLPEDIAQKYRIGQINYTSEYVEKFVIRSQDTDKNGNKLINLGIVKDCDNPEYYALQAIASYVGYSTDFRPYETEEFLYAWEQEHNADFFEETCNSESPSRDFEKYFASICLKDPAYNYNTEHAPLLTAYIEDYMDNYRLYCNMNASEHSCKHEDRQYNSLEMRLNWVKAALPEEVRTAIVDANLEFQIIDRSQELVDRVGCEFMGLYCPIGSLVGTSYEGTNHPIIFLVKGYENYFEDTARHEIGHFVCDYSNYNALNDLTSCLNENPSKLAYFSHDNTCVAGNTGEYFANAFAYYYCDMCDISEYWQAFCPELNSIIETTVDCLYEDVAYEE